MALRPYGVTSRTKTFLYLPSAPMSTPASSPMSSVISCCAFSTATHKVVSPPVTKHQPWLGGGVSKTFKVCGPNLPRSTVQHLPRYTVQNSQGQWSKIFNVCGPNSSRSMVGNLQGPTRVFNARHFFVSVSPHCSSSTHLDLARGKVGGCPKYLKAKHMSIIDEARSQ